MNRSSPSAKPILIVEPELGGRCSSLTSPAGREWLWRRPEATRARAAVQPGEPFIDAGGIEECFPTIAGAFDHGEVWSKPWRGRDDALSVNGTGYQLERTVAIEDAAVTMSYQLTAAPGFRFVWAGHTSVAVSNDARIAAPAGARVRLWPDHWKAYPNLVQKEGSWPAPLGKPLDGLAQDDSALFFMLLDLRQLRLDDRGDQLSFRLEVDDQPVAMAVWRNMAGWPDDRPYRSLAIEPAIGWHFDLNLAGEGETGVVPASGIVEWRLILSMTDAPGGFAKAG